MIDIDTIYNEDCLETMKRMNDLFLDLTVTSPPYDNLRNYNGFSFDFEAVAKELYRVTKDGGVVVWVVGDSTINGSESGTSFKQALFFKEIGFKLNDTMIYQKKSYLPTSAKRYNQVFEYMFVFYKKVIKSFTPIYVPYADSTLERRKRKFHVYNKKKKSNEASKGKEYSLGDKGVKKTNIWKIQNGHGMTNDKVAFQHPAIFPEQLVRDHIVSWSNEGDIVYDPFMGSGTTAKVAIEEKRNFIGSEISSEYCDIINKRITDVRVK